MSPRAARHPEGGRKAKRAYAAQPYVGPRDAGFYGLLWAAGMTAYAGGASPASLAAGGAVWAAWLFIAWRASCWLRSQEDFDSAAADAMASGSAGILLGGVVPGLAALGAMVLTRGQLWWEPLMAAGLAGMALNAAAAFLERSFRLGAFWAAVGLCGGLGHPSPSAPLAMLAALMGVWTLAVTSAQAAAFRHFPDGPCPEPRHLARDAALPAGILAVALLAAWIWTPPLRPKPVQILPRMNLAIWLPDGERRRVPSIPLFGRPPAGTLGEVVSGPSAASEGLGRLLGGLLEGGGRLVIVLAAAGAAAGGWLWWRRRKAAKDVSPEERRREILRGAGVQPRRKAPALPPPDDPREAVVYWYNRLRAELASSGIPRQEALTPAEYARALSRTPSLAEAPVEAMTELFQEAEYSVHPVGEPDRERAKAYYEGISARAAGPGLRS